jgi:DnaA-homolog protein
LNQLPLAIRLRERAVFDNFVAGPNAATVASLNAVAREAATGIYWLSGPPGVGKSHLLQATCALTLSGGAEAVFLSLSQLKPFGPESLDAWQAARVIALDDIAVVIGDRGWEQGLFRLHRDVEERKASLLCAAASPSLRLNFSLPDLASRFAAANLLTLRPLEEPDQREALRLRALARGLELPEESALYLQRRFRRDLSTLYELLDAIDEAAFRAQRRLTLPFIRQVLRQHVPDEPA